MTSIRYKDGYKYQLADTFTLQTQLKPSVPVETDYISLSTNGLLTIRQGYCWDGPSGPTIDTKNFMRGSLAHDALYQLMRETYLDNDRYRLPADTLLRELCLEDGMSWIRAALVFYAVKWFARPASEAPRKSTVLTAP